MIKKIAIIFCIFIVSFNFLFRYERVYAEGRFEILGMRNIKITKQDWQEGGIWRVDFELTGDVNHIELAEEHMVNDCSFSQHISRTITHVYGYTHDRKKFKFKIGSDANYTGAFYVFSNGKLYAYFRYRFIGFNKDGKLFAPGSTKLIKEDAKRYEVPEWNDSMIDDDGMPNGVCKNANSGDKPVGAGTIENPKDDDNQTGGSGETSEDGSSDGTGGSGETSGDGSSNGSDGSKGSCSCCEAFAKVGESLKNIEGLGKDVADSNKNIESSNKEIANSNKNIEKSNDRIANATDKIKDTVSEILNEMKPTTDTVIDELRKPSLVKPVDENKTFKDDNEYFKPSKEEPVSGEMPVVPDPTPWKDSDGKEMSKEDKSEKDKTPSKDPTPSKDKTPGKDPTPSKDKPPSKDPTPSKDKPSGKDPTPSKDKPPGKDPTPSKDKTPGKDPTPSKDKTPGKDPTPSKDPIPGKDSPIGRDPVMSRDPVPTRDPVLR
ncbi:hypothetical protein JC777_00120 (plasmid) [Bacillus cytotoxicus]|nr:hypothetical protein JC777_00120 [Bacillus cytotoxicus]QTR85213.1 hypothetical protein JC774_00120 [Bacillus cytotoxicus]